jgi:nitrogen-specific signal transduction histidine kinase
VETKAFPIRNAAGEVISAIETMNDITERHALEEERLKTQKLESIGILAGGIAHDFNNLLQGVFGSISMARLKWEDTAQAREMLGLAEQAIEQAVNLTTQLLTFSRGGKPVKRRATLRPLVERAVRFALSGSAVDCRHEFAEGLPQEEMDEGQMGQVIQNMVLNAVQAMPQGGTVVIRGRRVRSPGAGLPHILSTGDHVALEISDQGNGIAAADLPRIFDPYFSTKAKGSGLGLAVSYSIVRNHDGMIDVQSRPGQGSTFTIYLPAAGPGSPAAAPAPAVLPPGHAARSRILVMDDEAMIRTVTARMFNSLGHEAVCVAHGEAAVEAYRAARVDGRSFHLVILDLTIKGGMGGLETIRRLRELDPGVRAVVSSGYSDDDTCATYRDQGFLAFLKKPYQLAELKALLASLL